MITVNGEVQTNEEVQENTHDLHLFVTVQLLEDKFCEEHGYSYEWARSQNPHLTKDDKKILCKTKNFVPVVVPGLTSRSRASSSSTSLPQDSSRISPSPVRSRSDETDYQAPGNRRVDPITKIKNKK